MPIQFDNTNTGSVTLKGPASSSGTMAFPSANGSASQALVTDGSGNLSWLSLSSPAITGFTTSSANRSFTASGGTTNQGAAVIGKGSGGFLLNLPDGTSTGGYARGLSSVELMPGRGFADRIASGLRSVIIGGNNCKASGTDSIVIAGYNNISSRSSAIAIGGRSMYSGSGSGSDSGTVMIGLDNSGGSTTVSGTNQIFLGGTASATGSSAASYSCSLPGASAGLSGGFSFARTSSSASMLQLGGVTTSSTIKVLTVDAASAASSFSSTWGTVYGEAVARASNGLTKTWYFRYGITNAIVSGAVTNLYSDTGTSSWALTVSWASGGAISVSATGDAALTVRWFVRLVYI